MLKNALKIHKLLNKFKQICKHVINKENKKYTLREIRKDEELSKKFIEEQPASNVIHQLSETYKLADGVNIIQDVAKGEWSVKITGQTKTLIEGLTKTNKELKQLFYVTDKNNPNILHDTLVVDLNKVIEDDGTKLINFDKQSAKLNISVFCRNLYNEYNHVIENG